MKITVDTNILVRAVVRDDESQTKAAAQLLSEAEVIAVSIPCLCELVWVLDRVYRIGRDDISAALEALLDASNVAVDRPAADAGLANLKAGGDFADGVIAHDGAWLGGEIFVSFDKSAVALITKRGGQANLIPSS